MDCIESYSFSMTDMVLDADVSQSLARLVDANEQLRSDDSRESRERVCIETRATFTVLEDVLAWGGIVECDSAKRVLNAAFAASEKLMSRSEDSLFKAVERRRSFVLKYLAASDEEQLERHLDDSLKARKAVAVQA